MMQTAGRERREARQKDDGRRSRRAAACLLLTVLIWLVAAFPMAPGLGELRRTTVWLPAPVLEEALAGTGAGGSARPETVARRIRALLAPVYGAGHVVVQVSGAGAPEGARPPVSVAVIIDTSVMHGLPTSAEGLRVEQERLCTLISHAAGLSGAAGDSVAVSFLLFSDGSPGALDRWWLPFAAGAAVLALLALVLPRLRRRGQQSDGGAAPDGKMTAPSRGGRHARLARRLRAESPQAAAVALGLLGADDAARVLAAMPDDAAAAALACMASQSPVAREVLELVRDDCLDGFAADLDAFVSEGRACGRAASLMSSLDADRAGRLAGTLSRSHPEAWKRLEPLVD